MANLESRPIDKALEDAPRRTRRALTNGQSKPLDQIRSLFGANGEIYAYILPRVDAHQNEYIADRDCRVEYVSGFSGSNAFVVITKEKALLWTDGRYFGQAEKQLDEGWTLMKEGMPDSITLLDWLVQNVPSGSAIGFDPKLLTFDQGKSMISMLNNFKLKTISINENLVDLVWADRPAEELRKLICLDLKESGEDSQAKIARLRTKLSENKCDYVILNALDEIAWLLNIRGFDIPFNPVVFAVVVVSHEETFLFIDERKLSPEVSHHLSHVQILSYENVLSFLHDLVREKGKGKQFYVSDSVNYALGSIFDSSSSVVKASPVRLMKCYKNATELAGMRNASIRDSAAHIQFLLWIRRELDLGHHVTELRAANQMYYYRSKLPDFVSLSFETISAVGEHAALPHYKLTPESSKRLLTEPSDTDENSMNSVYLIDSGGHYRDGTTDVTRTIYVGSKAPDTHLKKMFTLVLRGHIDMATLIFPTGINAHRIEMEARKVMWQHGYDFAHGVGHGIGHFLNVHEYPPFLGFRKYAPGEGIQRGMVYTIEPGYYEAGNFGIRIENAYETVAFEAKNLMSKSTEFLTHVPLTYVPFQKSLIDQALLDPKHIAWINDYHNKCLEVVGKYLQECGLQSEYNFLAEACTPF